MSRQMLAKLHVAKKDLGLDDETYRDILERLTGQRSAKGLSLAALEKCLKEMVRLGWEPKQRAPRPQRSSNPQTRKIWALWNDICRRGGAKNPTRGALRAFVQNRTGVADPEWLNAEQATQVINELLSWQRRAGKARR